MDLRAPKHPSAMRLGFTLIELMIAITISLAITGSVIVNYNSYNTTQVLKQAALTLKNDIRLIQTKAASGEKPAGCGTLTGWSITLAESSYSYQASCDDTPTGLATPINLPPGITVPALPTVNPITFFVLSRGTNVGSSLTITLAGSGKQYSVRVNPAGDISDLGLQ